MNKTSVHPLIVYTPGFFSSIIGEQVPAEVHFLQPGLPEQDMVNSSQLLYTPQNLPLSTKEAKLCLQELLDFGDTHAQELRQRAFSDELASGKNSKSELSRAEDRDIKAFAATGKVLPQERRQNLAALERARLVNAQKTLLMGYSLERSIQEASDLIKSAEKAHSALAEALGSRELPFSLGSIDDMPRPDWSLVFSAMLLFVPDEAVFYSAHEEMQAALRDEGALKALTDEENALLFPVSSQKGWKFALGKMQREPFSGQDGAVSIAVPLERGA